MRYSRLTAQYTVWLILSIPLASLQAAGQEPAAPSREPPTGASGGTKIASSSAAGLWGVMAYAGVLMPQGALKDHVKSGTAFGLGIGKALYDCARGHARATLFLGASSKLKATESGYSGEVSVQPIVARLDWLHGSGVLKPYAGLGLGYYRWKTDISYDGDNNQHDGNDMGAVMALGAEWNATEKLAVDPGLEYHWVRGSFNERLMSFAVNVRWRL